VVVFAASKTLPRLLLSKLHKIIKFGAYITGQYHFFNFLQNLPVLGHGTTNWTNAHLTMF
jgi:hypothetical protein